LHRYPGAGGPRRIRAGASGVADQPLHRPTPQFRDGGKANYRFADGHVQALPAKEAAYVGKAEAGLANGDGTDGAPIA
jgi:prepilin-type processing-associated H-X9-DG protein